MLYQLVSIVVLYEVLVVFIFILFHFIIQLLKTAFFFLIIFGPIIFYSISMEEQGSETSGVKKLMRKLRGNFTKTMETSLETSASFGGLEGLQILFFGALKDYRYNSLSVFKSHGAKLPLLNQRVETSWKFPANILTRSFRHWKIGSFAALINIRIFRDRHMLLSTASPHLGEESRLYDPEMFRCGILN